VATGRHKLDLPVDRLQEGVYFCRLNVNGFAVAKKFLVVR
jgi:hypothetical protein